MKPFFKFSPRHVIILSWVNFVAMWLVIALIHGVSEGWWLSTLILYLPRIPWMIPALILTPLSLRITWKAALINVASVLLVLGPIMNWQCGGLASPAVDKTAPRITIVSCNVQSFRPHFDQVVHEINRINPDIVLFQEAFEDHPLVETLFEGWHVDRVDEYLTASKWPVRFQGKCEIGALDRTTVVRYTVATPHGELTICNVHQISPQHEMRDLRPWSIVTGSGVSELNQATVMRDVEALKAREFTRTSKPSSTPTVIAGDFNMPNDSSLFRQHWGDLTDAYAVSAVGYGYTSPCFANKEFLSNCPWAQVDHILATQGIAVERCWIGRSGGSDHRLIAAQFRLPKNGLRSNFERPDPGPAVQKSKFHDQDQGSIGKPKVGSL